jgi:glutamate--cysteine ligase
MLKESNRPWDWLSQLFRSEIRIPSERKVGLEIERIAVWRDGRPFLYRQSANNHRQGAEQLINELHQKYGWKVVESPSGEPIGLECPKGKVTLEPGSQVEFAVDPQESLIDVKNILSQYDQNIDEVIKSWKGLCFLGLAVNPIHRIDEIDVIPSPRYAIMTDILGRTGKFGTSMMRRTSSVQINLDYTGEKEAIEMLQVSLLVAPVSTALFANSPFFEGKPSGFLSMRSEIWRQTDNRRTGLLPQAFEPGFNFDSYASILWELPLMFVVNDEGQYVNAQNCSLNDISLGKLPGVNVNPVNMRSSVQQLFTEGRLKPGYVEVRSVDGQLPHYRLASAAFWLGLLYSSEARQLAFELLGNTSFQERDELWKEASKIGMKAKVKNISIKEMAQKLITKSEEELRRRGCQEEVFLKPLIENLQKSLCPAQVLLQEFQQKWHSDLKAMLHNCKLTIEKQVGEV